MLTFTNQKLITSHTRLTYSPGGTSSYLTVGTLRGYLRPLSEEMASVNGIQFGHGYQLIVETNGDIREGDKLVIDSSTFTVRGVANHDRGGVTAYKKCLLVLGQP